MFDSRISVVFVVPAVRIDQIRAPNVIKNLRQYLVAIHTILAGKGRRGINPRNFPARQLAEIVIDFYVFGGPIRDGAERIRRV
jgi:hypothetical protein